VDDWLNQLQRVPIDRMRDVLYNIEQFKGDALKLPDIKTTMSMKLTSGSRTGASGFGGAKGAKDADGPVYGAGAKSAGSIGNSEKTSSGANKMLSGGN
jgi:hypothetical protein